MFAPDGYMSARLAKSDRGRLASGAWFKSTGKESRSEASCYIANTGPFHVDEEKQVLTHSMFVSPLPNRTGQTQPRVVRLGGNTLELGTRSPIRSGGRTVSPSLVRRRADPT